MRADNPVYMLVRSEDDSIVAADGSLKNLMRNALVAAKDDEPAFDPNGDDRQVIISGMHLDVKPEFELGGVKCYFVRKKLQDFPASI